MSSIEWTERTWNPTTGCSIVSPGCHNCYAMRMAARLEAMEQPKYAGTTKNGRWTGKVNLVESALEIPLKFKRPTVWFVDSMSDLFHEAVPSHFIDEVFFVMSVCPQHTFQVLTKRADRMRSYFRNGEERWCVDPLPNVWLGVSVEQQDLCDRVEQLLETPAAMRFISAEPLLEEVDFCFRVWARDNTIDWVIVGGESGPGARPFDLDWARLIVEDCRAADPRIDVFVKQVGAQPYDRRGEDGTPFRLKLKSRKGSDPREWPEEVRVRETPLGRLVS